VGLNLVAALEEVKEYAGGVSESPEVISEEAVAKQNARALAELEKMMRGVK